MEQQKLEYYAFVWSLVRMGIAAVALLLGGMPPILKLVGMHNAYGGVWSLLQLCWIISGIAAVYLLYLWNQNGRTVFGGNDQKDTVAFFVMVVSGINLGLAGLINDNIGMSIFDSKLFYLIGAVVYVVTVYYLYTRWKESGEQLFVAGSRKQGGEEKSETAQSPKETAPHQDADKKEDS